MMRIFRRGILVESLLSLILLIVPTLSAHAAFTTPLAPGANGPEVSTLQQTLQSLGFYTYPSITGFYGPVTTNAVAAYQRAHSLDPIGVVGPATRASLNGMGTSVTTPSTTTSSSSNTSSSLVITRTLTVGASGADVSALQTFLQSQGFYTYPSITGFYGPVTAAAVSAYQAAHGLSPVGEVGPQTRALIAASSAIGTPSTGTSASPNTTNTTTGVTITTTTSGNGQTMTTTSGGGGGSHHNNSGSDDEETATPADTTAPTISSVTSSPSQTTAAITWTTNEASNSQVEYGTTSSYGSLTMLDTTLTTNHTVSVTGLTASTLYHYRVRSIDASGNSSYSNDASVTTTAVPDTTPPSRTAGSPSGTLALNTTATTISLTTNEAATCKYSLTSGVSYSSMSSTFGTTGGTSHTQSVSSLSNGSNYVYYVKCQDASLNSNVNDYAISFSVAADATVPTVSVTAPLNNAVVTGTSTTVTADATDDVSVSGVQFMLDGNPLGSEDTSSPFAIAWNTTLTSDGTHALIATARDGAGNVGTSSVVSVRVDNTAPVISSTTASGITTTGATITWTTDEFATSQVTYGTVSGSMYASSTSVTDTSPRVMSHSVPLTSLPPGTLYYYRVVSGDSTGHTATSSEGSFTTGVVVSAPTVTTSAASSVGSTTAILNGNITATGNASSTVRGFVYGTTTNSYTATSTQIGSFGAGAFSTTTTGLVASSTYYYKAFATNTSGTSYGSEQTFTTSGITFTQAFNDGSLTVLENWYKVTTGPRVPLTQSYTGTYTVATQSDADALVGTLVTGTVDITGVGLNVHDFGVQASTTIASTTLVTLIQIESTASSTHLYNFLADGQNRNQSLGIGGPAFTDNLLVEYGEIKRVGFDGLRTARNSVYQYLYMHNFRVWNNGTDGTYDGNGSQSIYPHLDVAQTIRSGNVIQKSWLQNSSGVNSVSVVFVQSNAGEVISSYTMTQNYLDGAGYLFHIHNENIDINNPGPNGYVTGVVIQNNLIGRTYTQGLYSINDNPSSGYTFSGNVWADTRGSVPAPTFVPDPIRITSGTSFSTTTSASGLTISLTSNNPATWSIIGGANQGLFALGATSTPGTTTISISNQAQGTYSVIVQATDAYSHTATTSISVTFTASTVAWTPSLYFGSNLVDWYDASATSTLTITASSTVSAWASRTSSGHTMTQAGTTFQPIYAAAGRNGLPTLFFDGVNDALVQTNVTGIPFNTAAFTYAGQIYGSSTLSGFKYYWGVGDAGGVGKKLGSNTGTIRFDESGTLSAATTTAFVNADRGIVLSLGAATSTTRAVSLSYDGTASTTGNVTISTTTPTRIVTGASPGSSGSVTNYWPGAFQEEFYVDRALTNSEIDMIHGYLAWKWGRQSALPVGHPYKNAAPTITI